MQSPKPGYVTLNDTKVKVQQWQQSGNRVLLTTLVRGDASGTSLLNELRNETVELQWDDFPTRLVKPEVTHHRATGSGPATVHRIEMTLWLTSESESPAAESMDAKLDRILQELQQLRAEVAQLRGARPAGTSSIAAH